MGVVVTLCPVQVQGVIEDAGAPEVVGKGLTVRALIRDRLNGLLVVEMAKQPSVPGGSRGLLLGLAVLSLLPGDGSTRGPGSVARELGLPASTVSRYLSTLVGLGLVERDVLSRQCRLVEGLRTQ